MSETENPVRPSYLRRGAVVAMAALALAGVAVLYGFGRGGKEAASGDCAGAAQTVARVAPLAHGEVAALAVSRRPAPLVDVAFQSPDGKTLHLADFRGKTLLLNLWATWCVPCREEMPSLDRLQARLGGPDFEVAAVDIDTTRLDRRKPFLDEIGVKSLAFYNDSAANVFQDLKKAGKVVGLPTTIQVDAKGCEIGVMAGPANWASDDAVKLIEAAKG
jgi:thiol-disulfide isomerase/thioredoxin